MNIFVGDDKKNRPYNHLNFNVKKVFYVTGE